MNLQYKEIIAHGCSVTHGSELVTAGLDTENVFFAFPNILANSLSLKCINLALPGSSNENIFHNTIKTIYENNEIILIVCWSTLVRETWKRFNETFSVNISWGSATIGDQKQKVFYDEKNNVSAVNKDYLEDLSNYVKFFKKYKTDHHYYEKKLKNYSKIIRDLCNNKKIKLIELQYTKILNDCIDISNVGKWFNEARHPNKNEHQEIGNLIYNNFFK